MTISRKASFLCRPPQRTSCRRGDGQTGLTLVSFAIILPILFLLVFGSLELFLYFRALGAVQRAAAEAAQVLAAASPGATGEYEVSSQPAVLGKKLVRSVSGGNTEHNLELSFLQHGRLYLPQAPGDDRTQPLPFPLSGAPAREDRSAMSPGVQFLPFVKAWTCLEPLNETSHALSDCGDRIRGPGAAGFLTYQLPGRMDFDGDGREDPAFFYPNDGGDDWWIIPSSSGTLFRSALRFELGEPFSSGRTRGSLPCPADYDGDGRTDLCAVTIPQATGGTSTALLLLRLSSEHYQQLFTLTLHTPPAGLLLPVPGRWSADGKDSFAAIVSESASEQHELTTLIWPPLEIDVPLSGPLRCRLSDRVQIFGGSAYRPSSGRYWRPAFGDHDGDGLLDIGWLVWAGGYSTGHAAGLARGVEAAARPKRAADARIEPWSLHYPSSPAAAGLYVVEPQNHRVSLITAGADGVLTGGDDGEEYRVIAGASSDGSPDYRFEEPDPMSRARDALLEPGAPESSKSCPACPAGGGYRGDGGPAAEAKLNYPRGAAGFGRGPLYIADYGNGCVRLVSPGSDGEVNGMGGETIQTAAGGVVPSRVSCPERENGAPGPKTGERALFWDAYGTAAQSRGIHPRCVALRPLSLALDEHSGVLFVGDEMGVIFAVYPGTDRLVDGDPEERLSILAGVYGTRSRRNPAVSGELGLISSLSFVRFGSGGALLAAVRWGASRAGAGSEGAAAGGGLIEIRGRDGQFRFTASGAVEEASLNSVAGSWGETKAAPPLLGRASAALRNPAAIAAAAPGRSSSGAVNVFSTGWWYDSSSNSFENSLLQVFSSAGGGSVRDPGKPLIAEASIRWLNNPHANSWGKQAPAQPPERFRNTISGGSALGVLPVEPGPGIAISPSSRYLYFSQPRLGQILVVDLDWDGDGAQDLPNPLDPAAEDKDNDGDGLNNEDDPFIYAPASWRGAERNANEPAALIRPLELFQDAVMWAAAPGRKLTAGAGRVDRLEWWMDRFAAFSAVPAPGPLPIAPGEESPALLLNASTVAAPNAMGALHGTPVWPGGVARGTEYNRRTGRPLLAPVIMSGTAPAASALKDISGYLQCADWSLDDAAALGEGLLPDGQPVSACGRSLDTRLYADGRTAATRRAHPAHWEGQWHPFGDAARGGNPLLFLDWDGGGVREPAVFSGGAEAGRPLALHIGNFERRQGMDAGCPGRFAVRDLSLLTPMLLRAVGSAIDARSQYECDAPPAPFFTASPARYTSLLVDAHAEWRTANIISFVSYEQQRSSRLSSAGSGAAQEGPVAEAAYRVLEHSLRVSKRGSLDDDYGALVTIEPPGREDRGYAVIKVSYAFRFNRFFGLVLGSPRRVITQSVRRRIYSFGREER